MHGWWLLLLSAALTVLLLLLIIVCNLRVALNRLRAQQVDGAARLTASGTLHVVTGSGTVVRLVAAPPPPPEPEPAHVVVPLLTVRDAAPAGTANTNADTDGEGEGVKGADDDEPCPVCLEPLAAQRVAAGPCGHWMHETCVRAWLMKDRARQCPVCRASMTVKIATAKGSDDVGSTSETGMSPATS